jgi:hypothetical protein
VVVPTNVVKNWGEEFSKWLPSKRDGDHDWSSLKPSGSKIITVRTGSRPSVYSCVPPSSQCSVTPLAHCLTVSPSCAAAKQPGRRPPCLDSVHAQWDVGVGVQTAASI